MADVYTSVGTILGTTADTTIYSGTTGSAIVNSIYVANVTDYVRDVTIKLVKGSTGYIIANDMAVPPYSTLQPVDSPLVLESNDTITAAGSTGDALHVVVSALEVY
jgi:hypothetical protein